MQRFEIIMTESKSSLVAILGTGPGLGAALAARFATGGCSLALLSRKAESRDPVLQRLVDAGHAAQGYDCDAGVSTSVAEAFRRIRNTQGHPDILIYNAGIFVHGGIMQLDPTRFEAAWRTNCHGAFLATREVLPAMCERGRGTLLYTGATAALRGGANFAGFAVGKFGLRALSQSVAREFGPQGIHAAHIVIDGQIGNPADQDPSANSSLDPEAIAESYWQLHCQPRRAWTQELDLRPNSEKF